MSLLSGGTEGELRVIGSRRRGFVKSSGESVQLIIRRLRCIDCQSIHHELPNLLVPYKRYEAESIEQGVTETSPSVAADESTLRRWKTWFAVWSPYAASCLAAIASRFHLPVKESSHSSQSLLQRLGRFVGNANGWLARVVRPIANTNLWIHTRSAFLS